MVSLHIAVTPGWESLFWDNTPFLYHSLLRIWVVFFGTGEVMTRALSLLFSLGTAGLMTWVLAKHLSLRAGIVVGALQALSHLSVFFAREVRPYAIFEMAFAWSLVELLLFHLGKGSAWRLWSSWVLLGLTNYLSLPLIAIQGGWLGVTYPAHRRVGFLGGGLALFLLGAAVFGFISWQHLSWQVLKFQVEGQAELYLEILRWVFNQSYLWCFAFLATLLVQVVGAIRKTKALTFGGQMGLLIFVCLVLAPLFSLIFQRSIFLPRYFVFLSPALSLYWACLVHDYGKEGLRRLRVASSLVFLGLLLSAWTLLPLYDQIRPPWRKLIETIQTQEGNLVLTSRTPAIQTPYFRNARIPLRRWSPLSDGSEHLSKLLLEHPNLWLVDSYWASQDYFDSIQIEMKQAGRFVERFEVTSGFAESLHVLHIRNQ